MVLMMEYGWLPWEVDRIPYVTVMELLAAIRLNREVAARGN
jgi:hypothetical protein